MITFYKYEGAGNDFIMINNLNNELILKPEYIKNLCDRRLGIGADGIILLEKSDKADCFMNYYNSDGSVAEMCGNGIRCTAKFFIEQTNSNVGELNIDTRAGIKNIKVNGDDTYSVDMGSPIFSSVDFPDKSTNIEGFDFQFVSMGNPHAVTFVDDLNKINIKEIGSKVETNKLFLNKINVEFVEKIKDNYFKVKVWERGCGETLACGTGACAVYSILSSQGLSLRKESELGLASLNEITLEFPGGKLFLSKNEKGHVILRGPATFVFEGIFI